MADDKIHQDHLRWSGGGWNSAPIWPREPEIDTIESIAKLHLVAELPDPLDDGSMKVSFFAEGGFNRLYEISYADHHTVYLLRAALPIIPYYKTESEVATIAYLRANTSIRVPRVFAWDSNFHNQLTYEWILMEKLAGVPLYDVWRKVPWDCKLELTEKIAEMVKQMRGCKFDCIGGLYFTSAVDCGPSKLETASEAKALLSTMLADKGLDADIKDVDTETSGIAQHAHAVSRSETNSKYHNAGAHSTHDEALNESKRSAEIATNNEPLTADPWPVKNEGHDDSKHSVLVDGTGGENSLKSRPTVGISIEPSGASEAMGTGQQSEFSVGQVFDSLFFKERRLELPGNRGPYTSSLEWLTAEIQGQLRWIKNGPIEDDEDYDSDFDEDAPEMEALCHEFLDYLPTVLGDNANKESFTLHHHDLNAANILVNPETFEIIGIVDWELINVVPEWKTADHPKFLQGMEPEDEIEPRIPSYEDEDDIAVLKRDRWDTRILRRHFDKTMDRLAGKEGVMNISMQTKMKRHCHQFISELTDMWGWSKKWLLGHKTTGISKNHADWSRET